MAWAASLLALMIGRPITTLIFLALGSTLFAQEEMNTLSADEKAAGWKLLFDGKSAPGLRGLQKSDFLKAGWEIKDGALVLPKTVRQSGTVTGGDLVTAEQFTDFEFSFDFKFTSSGVGGIVYFARSASGGKASGHEYQIIDDVHHPDGLKGGPLRRTGALYGVLAPAANKKLNESDTWNSGAIVVRGSHVEHWLNGTKVVEYDCGSKALAKAVTEAKAKVPMGFGTKIKSSLAILDKGEEVAYRNLKIRALVPGMATPVPATPVPATPAPVPPVTEPAPGEEMPAAPAPGTPAPEPVPAATPAAVPAATPVPKAAWTPPPLPPPPVLRP